MLSSVLFKKNDKENGHYWMTHNKNNGQSDQFLLHKSYNVLIKKCFNIWYFYLKIRKLHGMTGNVTIMNNDGYRPKSSFNNCSV